MPATLSLPSQDCLIANGRRASGFGLTSTGAYVFKDNGVQKIVFAHSQTEASQQGLDEQLSLFPKPPAFSRGVADICHQLSFILLLFSL